MIVVICAWCKFPRHYKVPGNEEWKPLDSNVLAHIHNRINGTEVKLGICNPCYEHMETVFVQEAQTQEAGRRQKLLVGTQGGL